MRVLLVEDNPLLQEQLKHMLRAVGAQTVAVAATSAEALQWLQAHPQDWDLAVVDIFLARGHGFEVLRQCRQRGGRQRAVILSNYTRDPVREHARTAGADAVFDKCLEMDAFVSYCRELVRAEAADRTAA